VKLNLAIFAYHLGDYSPELYDPDLHTLNVADIRILNRQETFNPESAYLATYEQLKGLAKLPSKVICVGADPGLIPCLEEQGVKALNLSGEAELNTVFDQLQDIFLHYNRLEADLLEAVLEKQPLQLLLNISADFFANPAFITDANLCLMATCDNYAHPESDLAWKETIESGYSSSELLRVLKRKRLTNVLNTTRKAVFVEVDKRFPKVICTNYFAKEVRIATFTISEAYTPLSPLQVGLVDYVARLLTAEVNKQSNATSRYMAAIRSNIANLLHGQNIDAGILKTNFEHIGWTSKDTYRVLKIPLTPAALLDGTAGHDKKVYESIFEQCVSLDMNEVLILVIRCQKEEEKDRHSFASLRKYLKAENAACGVSKRFHDFELLGEEYKLANAALEMGRWKYPEESLYFYEDLMLEHLLNEGSRFFHLRSLCEDAVLRLAEYDLQNGSNLVETLKVYLLQERSLLAASQELHIHRNTLVYRLNKIEQLSSLDLSSPSTRLNTILSCVILEYLDSLIKRSPK